MRHLSSKERGFTLIEALVALLVLSFGLLAIASFQVTLARSADLAKQRSEATRLAQQKMESLRAYGQVGSDTSTPHKVNYTDDVVSSTAPEVTVSNATFNRTWTVTSNAAGTEKWINVQVAWTDRTGQPQSVQLFSVISKFDPRDIGTLATGPGVPKVRRPKNRNINIPYPAVTLSGGTQSAFIPPPGNIAYVFNNETGNIVQSCSGLSATGVPPPPVTIQSLTGTGNTVTVSASGHAFVAGNRVTIAGTPNADFHGTFDVVSATPGVSFTYTVGTAFTGTVTAVGGTATQVVTQLVEGLDLGTAAGVACTGLDAYLLSGYVRFDTSNNPTGEEPGNPEPSNNTLPLDAVTPLSLTTSNFTANVDPAGAPAMTCYSQRQKVVTAATTPVTITTVSLSGNVVTVNAPGHTFIVGDVVAINGVSSAAFIGSFTVQSVAAGTSFTYILPPPLPTATTGNGGTAVRLQRLTIPETTTLAGYTTEVSKFVAYACIVEPRDHDNSAASPKRWWGRVTLNPNTNTTVGTAWTIASGSGYKVCRYSADWNGDVKISNSEHPQWYRGVTGALDSQNYLVIDGNRSCPTDKPQNLLSSPVNFTDDTTANHQPTAELSFQCPSGGCGTKSVREPSDTSADLPMD
jgi:type IV pilus modification protein PilV